MRVARVEQNGLGEVKKVPTPQEPREGIERLAELVRKCADGERVEAVAGGFPGAVLEGAVRGAPNLPKWEGFALEKELSHVFGGSPVIVRNDADFAALGEAVYGAGTGARVVGYVGIGTGVGGGRVVDGKIDSGTYGLEPGHQIIDARELKDLEALVSGRAFEERFHMHPKNAPREAYEEMTRILSVGLYNTIAHWSPEVLVLGGSMMNDENGFRIREVEHALRNLPNRIPRIPEFRPALLKDAAGLHGARALLTSRPAP